MENMLFTVGKPVTGDDFFDRTKIIVNVKRLLSDRQDFMIKAPRRYGKTSLIKQALMSIKEPHLYLDLRRESRMENIAEQIIDFAFSHAGVSGFFRRMREGVATFLIGAKHEVKIKSEIFEYSVEFFSDSKKQPRELLMRALQTAEEIAVALDTHFIIVFDEFQDISRFICEGDVLEMMRGTIQHHNRVHYAFLGSIEHLMTMIFEDKRSPFYNYCRKLKLPPFDTKELAPQLIAAFKKRQIVFKDEDDLLTVLERLSGHPTNTMLVMQHIYYLVLDQDVRLVSKEIVEEAYENAFAETHDLIEQYVHELKGKKHYYDVLCRLARKEPQILTLQALNQIYKGLIQMGYIANVERGVYLINDGFLVEYAKWTDLMHHD